MGHDKEKIAFLQRVLGLALTGVITEQCLFVFHGPGANGKSTILETIRELLADYATHTTTASLLQSRGSPIRNDLARLNSARFVSAVEIGMGKKLDEALVKQLTGGDQVTARFLYNEFFEFKPKFKLFISANHKPEIRGIDHGIWRRIHLIPFNVSIPSEKIDKDLPMKLRQELPGILNWAVQGCYDWQSQGLNPPDSIQTATAEYRAEMDILSGFLEDRCIIQSSEKIAVGKLYEAFKIWADLACQETVGKKIFGNLMRQKGFTQSKSGSIRYWNGIKLNPEDNADE
jgi:putative DNA primase/helicase